MKDYRERRNCRWKKSLNDLAGRLGTFSLLLRRQGKATRQKNRGRSRGMEGMYVRTYVENLEKYSRNSVKTDVNDRG